MVQNMKQPKLNDPELDVMLMKLVFESKDSLTKFGLYLEKLCLNNQSQSVL